MPLRSDWSGQVCPIARGVGVLGDPWTLLILREIFAGNRRFDGLRSDLQIADNVLSRRLSELVSNGLLTKVPYAGSVRQRYEYQLTDSGRAVLPVIHAVARWGAANTESPDPGMIMTIVCARCRQPVASADWCGTCGEPLTVEHAIWYRARDPERPVELALISRSERPRPEDQQR